MKTIKIFPRRIYIVREDEVSNGVVTGVYYLTYKNLSEIPEDQRSNPVGIYDLIGKKTLEVKKELV